MSLWRQGDVLIKKVSEIPKAARTRSGTVLVRGEATGHSHRISDKESGSLFEFEGKLYMRIPASAVIVHEEHGPIALPPGDYLVWQQREYSPASIRTIRD